MWFIRTIYKYRTDKFEELVKFGKTVIGSDTGLEHESAEFGPARINSTPGQTKSRSVIFT